MNDILTTCAVLYRFEDKFLICHATRSPYWGLPKGIEDPDDIDKAYTASRELYEETNIIIPKNELNFLGIYDYTENKNMALFEYWTDEKFPIDQMKCISMFNDNYGRKLPEVDAYKYVTLKESRDYVNRATFRILKKVVKSTTPT